MTAEARPAGSEFISEDAFIPTSWSAHAVMVAGDPDLPAAPCVMLELEGVNQSDLQAIAAGDPAPQQQHRILLTITAAGSIANGIRNSIHLLSNLERNQEGR